MLNWRLNVSTNCATFSGIALTVGRKSNIQFNQTNFLYPIVARAITHSTGRNKEKGLQQESLQSLIFTQSGRRDLNPRPPEPHSGALPDCATSRNFHFIKSHWGRGFPRSP